MALVRLRPAHALGPELDRQPIDQPRQLAFARRLLDQAVLRRAEFFRPLRRQREGIEAELGVERRRLVGKQPLEMLRLAAGDRGRDRSDGDAAVDAIAAERQPPRAEPPLLAACATSIGTSRSSAWDAASGWVAGSSSLSKARGGGSVGAAVSGSGLRPSIAVERIDHIFGAAKPPRQRQPRHLHAARRLSSGRAARASAPCRSAGACGDAAATILSRGRGQGEAASGYAYRPHPLSFAAPSPRGRGRSRQRPRRRGRRRDRHARGQPKPREAAAAMSPDQPSLAAEQMRDSADVEPQAVARPPRPEATSVPPIGRAARPAPHRLPGSAGTATSAGSSARASVSRAPGRAPRSAAAW